MASATRIWRSTTGQFDQITAVSQSMINDQLITLMQNLDDLKVFNPTPSTLSNASCAVEDGLLKPCSIAIPAEQSDFSTVKFYINFESGKLVYDEAGDRSTSRAPIHEEYDLANWVVCFNVKMGLANVDPQQLEEVKRKINVTGDYSIQRLFFDFTTSEISTLILSESNFGGLDYGSNSRRTFRNVFEMSLRNWLDHLNENGVNVCYHGTAPDNSSVVNPIAPSFPPEEVNFQTYPFKRTDGKSLTAEDKTRNSLLYLETCIKPAPTDKFLAYSGNYVTNGDDQKGKVNGTMLISRKIFFNNFLLPLLKEFNLRTQITPTMANNVIDGLMFKFKWNFATGWDPSHTRVTDNYYNFALDLPNRRWRWNVVKPDKTDNAGSTGFMRSSIRVKGDTQNELKWYAGGTELLLKVESHYRLETWNEQVGIDNDSSVDVRIGFEMLLMFQSVSKGVLQIDTYFPKADKSNRFNKRFEDAIWTKGSTHASSIFEKKPDDRQDQIKQRWIRSMGENNWFIERMTKALSEHRFVFPGNGTYSFLNPCFNANGDLMVELAYDGLTKPSPTGNLSASVPNVPVASDPGVISGDASIKK